MIYRRKLRSVLNSTETTAKTDSISSNALDLVLLTTDALYLGFKEKFACRYFVMGTANTNAATLTLTTWDGAAWQTVEDKIDQTNGLTQSGFISWKNRSDWQKHELSPITDEELYWLRIKTSANFSASTTLQAILNLFCDNVLLSEWYPELVSDTRYLPPGKSNFYEQFNAGKNMLVQELIKMEKLRDETQILNPEECAIGAVHASAYCILNGIPSPSEDLVARKKEILDTLSYWVNGARFSFDLDNSGEIEEPEENVGTQFFARR